MEVPMVVNDFLFRAESLYGPKEAVVDGDKRFTYAEFAKRCYKLAHALAGLGVAKGDRVGILSPNSHHFLESFYGPPSSAPSSSPSTTASSPPTSSTPSPTPA